MAKTTPTAVSTDADEVKDLVLWARSERIAVSSIQVGQVRIEMADLTLASSLVPPKPSDEQLRKNLYAEFGGEALEQATGSETENEDEYDGTEEDE